MANKPSLFTLFALLVFAGQALAQNPSPPLRCSSVTVDTPSQVLLGKSTVVKLSMPAARMVVGGLSSTRAGRPVEVPADTSRSPGERQMMEENRDGVADVDVMLLSPTELFFIGKRAGSMNVVLETADGQCTVKDLIVTVDPGTLQATLAELMPEETGVKVKGAQDSLVLTGVVSSAIKLDEIVSLANSYGDAKKMVNLLRVSSPQQVMLEVKVAEVSKTLLDRLGASVDYTGTSSGSGYTYHLLSQFPSGGAGLLEALKVGKAHVVLDGQKDDGLARVLAEPNIMAISGQQASFLSGGKIFIPVAQANALAGPTVTLEEREFGIGVKFTPTVLDVTRVNLKMVTEVSELSQTGSPFTTVNGVTSVLPSLTVRRADTTVQLNDGQSFVIAGLISNNSTEAIKRFPILGEIPILGALFRSTEFQKSQTELLFVITPRLVKPLAQAPTLPTDNHVEPSRAGYYLNGSMEGSPPAERKESSSPAAEASPAALGVPPAQAAPAAPAPQEGAVPSPAASPAEVTTRKPS